MSPDRLAGEVTQNDWRNTTIGAGSNEPNEQRATRRSYGRADQVKSKGYICLYNVICSCPNLVVEY